MSALFCRHQWGKYGPAFQAYSGGNHQARRCEKCGAIVTRRIVSTWVAQVSPQQINESLPKGESA